MAFTKQEVDDMKLSIQNEYVMLNRVKNTLLVAITICCACVIAILFTHNSSYTGIRKTIVTVIATVSGIFGAFGILSYRNGRKHVLKRINYLDQNK